MIKSLIKTFQKNLIRSWSWLFFLFVGNKLIVAWFPLINILSVSLYLKVVLLSEKKLLGITNQF